MIIYYIAWFIMIFTLLQLLIAFVNLIFLSKPGRGKIFEEPLISVLIPARNEENNIGNILDDLLNQDYNNIEIIVFNDQSEDLTAKIVQEYSLKDGRIKLVDSHGLPSGWLGKNYACHSLSKHAGGDYYLFIDADVRVGRGLLTNSISYMNRYKTGLISIFPKQIMISVGERLTVPNMNYILLSLLPLIMVRKSPNYAFAAANGQFMLFGSSVYRSLYPHEKMKDCKVEDIAIARYLKKEKYRIACLVGDDSIRCRMYKGCMDAVNGFSRNVAAFFGNSLILACLFWFVTTFGFIFVLLAFTLNIFVLYLIMYLVVRILISLISGQNVINNLLLTIPQQITCGLFIIKAVKNKLSGRYEWKGRDIY